MIAALSGHVRDSDAPRARRGQAGLTLIELMVVVAIVGILVSAAVVSMDTRPGTAEVANRLANLLRETSRKAVAGGPVRADVALAVPTKTARTQLRLFYDANDNQVAVIERLEEVEGAPDANWVEIGRSHVPRGVELAGYTAAPKVGTEVLAPEEAFDPGDEIAILCHPSGECDGVTLYLRAAGGAGEVARVANLALGGPVILDSW